MKSDSTTFECPACHGSGEVPMPEHFKPLLSLLQRFPDSKVLDLHKKLKEDISRGAVHNRLDDLVKAKLVKRRRVGKFFKYSLK